jgi:nanoRNase/pAp phosphatase (c-di-AMP/oligoRNAs hydrolase)
VETGLKSGIPMLDIHVVVQKISDFLKIVGKRPLFIQTHDIPDPDAIASAEAFRIIARHFGVKSSLVTNGMPQRRENQTLIRECHISLESLDEVKITPGSSSAWAFIDCMPGGGNVTLHPLAPGEAYIAIDHHGRPHAASRVAIPGFVLVEPDVGATATLLCQALKELHVPISARLASALSYAIISDTQDFSRSASQTDLNVYAEIFPHTDQRIISRIRNSRKSRQYFHTVHHCLENARIYRNMAWVWVGEVESGEIVAEMADFLLSREHITWTLSLGNTRERMYLSIRSSSLKANCAGLIRKLVPFSPFTVGGHDRFAGGYILMENTEDVQEMAEFLTDRFMRHILHIPASLPAPGGVPFIEER